jgi:thiol-disulfide isomerase/thioredoxin
MTRTALAVAAILSTPALAAAQSYEFKSLEIGDPAPAIEVSHWIKGDRLKAFEPGKVYVLDFWATWCGPCRTEVPHVSGLQKKYADYGVSIIAISDEDLQTVVGFLAKADSTGAIWYDKMEFTIATDPDTSAKLDYMTSAGQSTIPSTFIIGKDGRIEWIGSTDEIDEPLVAVVRDTWDRAAFATKWDEKMAEERERMGPFYRYHKARSVRNWHVALAAVDELIAANPDDYVYKYYKFMLLVRDLDRPEEAYAWGREAAEQHWDEYKALNTLAWRTVDTKGIKTRDLEFALKLALRANELTEEKNASILDTLARVYYEMGDLDQAIEWQRKAVYHATKEATKFELNEVLIKYEQERG